MGTNGFTDHRKTFMGETPDTACTVLCDYCGDSLHCEEHDIFWKDTANHKCVPMLEAERDALQAQLAKAREGLSLIAVVGYSECPKVSEAIARQTVNQARETLALLDTPTPTSAPSPDDLVRAALEWAAEIGDHACKNMETIGLKSPEDSESRSRCLGRAREAMYIAEKIRAAATDPATVAAIIERAGK
jgi:hypothetical protein